MNRQNASYTRGFTLIELMITVAIVGILAAIAYPSYQEQVRKSRRADCQGVLVSAANAVERYFTEHNTYVGASLGAGGVYTNRCPVDGGTAYYNLTVPSTTATAFSLQAAPTGSQANDRCGTLTLNNLGERGISSAAAGMTKDLCW